MSAADRPFINQSTQREKEEVLRNERKLKSGDRQSTTYHAQAMAGLDEPGGRFSEARYVSGSEPSTNMPRLPANSPWAHDPVPPEEPLGYSVNDLEPTGEAHELGFGGQETGGNAGPHLPLRPNRKSTESASEVSCSPPPLAGDSVSLTPTNAVGSAAASSPAALRRSPATPLPEQPDDGLPDNIARRDDGWPLSHTIKHRKVK
jgi:hypothetical protein